MRRVEFSHSEKGKLICDLCPHHCKFKKDNQTGKCRFRKRIGDEIIALNYGMAASIAVDPIEKKPLYHFKPGSVILSTGANGCNFQCSFCQNCEISQGTVPTRDLTVAELVAAAETDGSIGVAFTYSEPMMWYEFVLDASQELQRSGYASVLVTNGFIEEAPLRKLLPHIDAMNIDLKSMDDEFYKRLCKGRLEPVQRTIQIAYDAGVHIELTHLMVSGWNDNVESIARLAEWIASIDDEIPLHLSRYFPRYKLDEPATSESMMIEALAIAQQKLKFVYLGNIAGIQGADTICPDCGTTIVERSGYRTIIHALDSNSCSNCGRNLPFK